MVIRFKSIGEAPIRFRSAVARGKAKVARDGGEAGAGAIHDISVITRGEALGHDLWIDRVFLDQVRVAGNGMESGAKSRFTHPGLSGDGLGRTLGRFQSFRRRGDQVLADLHFLESAHATPEGDLAAYVMDFAEESPDLFGASIVFSLDYRAMDQFSADNADEQGRFVSDDEENKSNLMHARLQRFHAADIVDDPAANPDGLFSAGSGDIPAVADSMFAYALGLCDDAPPALDGLPHPARMRAFAAQALAARGMRLENANEIDALRHELVLANESQNEWRESYFLAVKQMEKGGIR